MPIKKESKLRATVKAALKQLVLQGHKIHVTWVESHATVLGAPDLEYCCYGVEGWIELKAFPDPEVRASQVTWMKDRIAAGGHPLFLFQNQDAYTMVPGSAASHIRQDPSWENVLRHSTSLWPGSLPSAELMRAMRNPRREYDSN